MKFFSQLKKSIENRFNHKKNQPIQESSVDHPVEVSSNSVQNNTEVGSSKEAGNSAGYLAYLDNLQKLVERGFYPCSTYNALIAIHQPKETTLSFKKTEDEIIYKQEPIQALPTQQLGQNEVAPVNGEKDEIIYKQEPIRPIQEQFQEATQGCSSLPRIG